jgi:hypothetical protein
MAYGPPRVVDAQTNLTTSGPSAVINVQDLGSKLNLLVDVTVVVAGTLDIEVEWSHDGVKFAAAETPDVFAQISAVGLVIIQFVLKAPIYRLDYVVASTPDFDFTVTQFVTS